MAQICFATFVSVLQKGLVEDPDWRSSHMPSAAQRYKAYVTSGMAGQLYTVMRVLYAPFEDPGVQNRNGGPIDITDRFASELCNQASELPASFVQQLKLGSLEPKIVEEFNDIYQEISRYQRHDVIQGLLDLIDADGTVSRATREDMHKYCDNSESLFLAQVFIYACCQPNKFNKKVNTDDFGYLLHLTNGVCPVCKKENLVQYEDDGIIKKFVEVEFTNIKTNQPSALLLCPKCDKNHRPKRNSTVEKLHEFDAMMTTIITQLELNLTIQNIFESSTINSNISVVVKQLLENSESLGVPTTTKTDYVPKKVADKILPSFHTLESTIQLLVSAHFGRVKAAFLDLDPSGNRRFEAIRQQVSACYLDIADQIPEGMMMPQVDIFYGVSEWIARQAGVEQNSQEALIIAAFFVQNCEVFDEISK